MAKQDALLKDFFSSNDHFIDLFNAKLFDGKSVLKAECCKEMNTGFVTKNESEKFVDVVRMYEDVPGVFKSSFQDFEMNLIEINGKSTYTFNNKDVSDLVEITRSMYDDSIHGQEKLKVLNKSTRQVKKLVGNITNSEWLVQNEDEEDIDMCEAEKAWAEKLKNIGREEGLSQGQNETIKTLSKTMSVEDIAHALSKTPAEIETILKD